MAQTSSSNKLGWVLKIICCIVAVYCICIQYWMGVFLALPVIIVDSVLPRYKSDNIATIIKIFLILQAIFIWYWFSHDNFHSHSSTSSLETIKKQNTYSTGKSLSRHIIKSHVEKIPKRNLTTSNSATGPNKRFVPTHMFSVSVFKPNNEQFNKDSHALVKQVIGGELLQTDFPDLRYRTSDEVKGSFPRVFKELPPEGFSIEFKNPCWIRDQASAGSRREGGDPIACLPYAYVLGQPKCGTSDLFERMKKHDKIIMPRRKEVRWFTRGEFTTFPLTHEGDEIRDGEMEGLGRGGGEQLLGPGSSIYSFTSSFSDLSRAIGRDRQDERAKELITVDGGPHSFWWPTQSPDGVFLPGDIPVPQIIREIQPGAKFIITLSDPVKRMYSDYYFLDDNLKPVRPGADTDKSAEQFHDRAEKQVNEFNSCVQQYIANMKEKEENKGILEGLLAREGAEGENHELWFRATQMCAHNRHQFGRGGWGRLSIGLYALYLEKWLEHFSPTQFLVVRLEDYALDPKAYMTKVFDFLGVGAPADWTEILKDVRYNEHRIYREPIKLETEELLREFYRPYNHLLASFLDNEAFKWEALVDREGVPSTLHDMQVRENELEEQEQEQEERDSAKFSSHNSHSTGSSHSTGNQHGESRLDHEEADGEATEDHHQPAGVEGKKHRRNPKLRGSSTPIVKSEPFTLTPQNFSITDLPYPEDSDITTFFGNEEKEFTSRKQAASQLCISAFGLDIPAIKFLLWDIGVAADLVAEENAKRNAFHCLALLFHMVDPHPKSQVFAHLLGKESWLSPHLNPALEKLQTSVLTRDVMDSIGRAIGDVAKWLQRAGVPPNDQDSTGHTPLHLAAVGGEIQLVRILLEMGSDPNIRNREGRTPLHFAAAYGHAEVAGLLLEHHANKEVEDKYGVSPLDMIANPGAISPEDALRYMNIVQRPARQIARYIHPELNVNDTVFGWEAGTGGWDVKRLKGYETDMGCSGVDQYLAGEITGEEVFSKYLARSAPVLIRGLLTEWDAAFEYEHDILKEDHGKKGVQVSDIPYATKFGGTKQIDMKLAEYIDQMKAHKVVGGHHPWYVFKPHPIPGMSEIHDSLVRYDLCPTPEEIHQAFLQYPGNKDKAQHNDQKARGKFVNAQWALGGEGTGAPIHFHNTAWNALIYGAKKWVIYPPHHMIMSNKQILDFVETDMETFAARGVKPMTCVQTAGDVMLIPESWGHGVLNLQESIAVATESKYSLWRVSPQTALFNKFPGFDDEE